MYGLIPARKAFSICLRCQARIAAKTSFHHSSAPTHLAGRSFHQTRRQLENQEIAYDEGQHDELPVDHGPDSAEGAPARSRHRGRSFRRLNVNQWEVALGVDALGKPAQIRIVKDASPQRSKEKETQVENKADDADAKLLREEFLDALATEKNKVNTAVVYEHIEAIRSKFLVERDSSKIPETLRELVAKQLQDGFTVAQLKRYIKDHPSRMPSAADNLEQAYSSKIYTRSKWTSGVSSFPGEALKRLEDTELQARNKQPFKLYANSSRKERLVETILHELWGIRSRIDREVDGELDISIAGPQFEVLFRNSKF